MIVVGDISIPNSDCAERLHTAIDEIGIFSGQTVISNLEGVTVQEIPEDSAWKVYNHAAGLHVFSDAEQYIVSLANNHIYDYPDRLLESLEILRKAGIKYTGVGEKRDPNPFIFMTEGRKCALFCHAWELYAKIERPFRPLQVCDVPYEQFLRAVAAYRAMDPEAYLICYFHWNFDFETLPFPAHRKLARALIECGADAVLGGHTHFVQGGEVYRGKPIIYGLGNFYMPDGYFFNGKLYFPSDSHITVAIELHPSEETVSCHWLTTDKDGVPLSLIESEDFTTGERIGKFSPYRGMDDKKYECFFKRHRKKSRFVPILNEFEDKGIDRLKQLVMCVRVRLVRMLKRKTGE